MSADSSRTITFSTRNGSTRTVLLDDYLDAAAIEAAERNANAWIKKLRVARIDGRSLRDRLDFRGDSLWWFVELYLHKQRTVVSIFRTLLALDALREHEQPTALTAGNDDVLRALVPQFAARHCIDTSATTLAGDWLPRLRVGARAHFHTLAAIADRLRPAVPSGPTDRRIDVVAFVHSAFWRRDRSEEGYIGPVLRAIEERLPGGRLALVGLGPRTNFRVRRWRHRLAEFNDPNARELPFIPIELLAGRGALRPSLDVWHRRRTMLKALCDSEDIRGASVFDGFDAWPLVRQELLGVTHLQLPWSARCMDEAAAALDALNPRVIVTYAEAGGWGRALVLEARRRGIPAIGLQHGFIYRHWLNYLHEPDEMQPSVSRPSDRGFPYPDLTLLYDGFARRHLLDSGHFPDSALAVTGSPRLESFAEAGRRLTPADRDRIRSEARAKTGQKFVVLATKFTQIGAWLAPLVAAVRSMPDVHLVVKCHPAETPEPYERVAADVPNVRVLAAGTDLAALVACADLVVTVNSTAAIEAMAVDVPGLVLALPNNLSPFVDAGALAGASTPDDIATSLARLLYDQRARQALADSRSAFVTQYGMLSEGGAATRAAELVLHYAGMAATPEHSPHI